METAALIEEIKEYINGEHSLTVERLIVLLNKAICELQELQDDIYDLQEYIDNLIEDIYEV